MASVHFFFIVFLVCRIMYYCAHVCVVSYLLPQCFLYSGGGGGVSPNTTNQSASLEWDPQDTCLKCQLEEHSWQDHITQSGGSNSEQSTPLMLDSREGILTCNHAVVQDLTPTLQQQAQLQAHRQQQTVNRFSDRSPGKESSEKKVTTDSEFIAGGNKNNVSDEELIDVSTTVAHDNNNKEKLSSLGSHGDVITKDELSVEYYTWRPAGDNRIPCEKSL